MEREAACKLVESLYTDWHSTLVRFGTRLCGSREAAEDAAQESFMALYREYRKDTVIGNPKGYTLRAVRNQISARQRNDRSRAEVRMAAWDLDTFESSRGPAAEEFETSERIDRFLAALTPREAEVVLLRLEGLKYKEIARELGIALASVSTLLARALRRIESRAAAEAPPDGTAEWERHAPKTLQ